MRSEWPPPEAMIGSSRDQRKFPARPPARRAKGERELTDATMHPRSAHIHRRAIYDAGDDHLGRRIVVVIPKAILDAIDQRDGAAGSPKGSEAGSPKDGGPGSPRENGSSEEADAARLDRFVNFVLLECSALMDRACVMVYCHHETPELQREKWTLMQALHKSLPKHLRKNLKVLYALHGTLTLRLFFEFSSLYLSDKFLKSKLLYTDRISDLQSMMAPTDVAATCMVRST